MFCKPQSDLHEGKGVNDAFVNQGRVLDGVFSTRVPTHPPTSQAADGPVDGWMHSSMDECIERKLRF